jgi:hypothetical protein
MTPSSKGKIRPRNRALIPSSQASRGGFFSSGARTRPWTSSPRVRAER